VEPLPPALLLDLDDTILDDTSTVESAWDGACSAFADRAGGDGAALRAAVHEEKAWYWADEGRHRLGRLDLLRARTEICAGALRRLGLRDGDGLAGEMARDYARRRHESIRPFPGALEALGEFRRRGVRLALLTNGASEAQRGKIGRFGLGPLLDHVLVEGELGFGKPDPRVFRRALDLLGAAPGDAWMVGDDLGRDVAGARGAGVRPVWVDARGRGLPADPPARPDRVVRALAELLG
jgi:putative hydrolase of the HAD superfamily